MRTFALLALLSLVSLPLAAQSVPSGARVEMTVMDGKHYFFVQGSAEPDREKGVLKCWVEERDANGNVTAHVQIGFKPDPAVESTLRATVILVIPPDGKPQMVQPDKYDEVKQGSLVAVVAGALAADLKRQKSR